MRFSEYILPKFDQSKRYLNSTNTFVRPAESVALSYVVSADMLARL